MCLFFLFLLNVKDVKGECRYGNLRGIEEPSRKICARKIYSDDNKSEVIAELRMCFNSFKSRCSHLY